MLSDAKIDDAFQNLGFAMIMMTAVTNLTKKLALSSTNAILINSNVNEISFAFQRVSAATVNRTASMIRMKLDARIRSVVSERAVKLVWRRRQDITIVDVPMAI